MLPLVTAAQMRRLDRLAIETWGIPGVVLMENAGRAVADAIEAAAPELAGLPVVVVCGKGNNGGDGFVITRHLLNRGAQVECLLLGKLAELSGDARANAEILTRAGIPLTEVTDPSGLADPLNDSEIVVDAIFGTGLESAPEGIFAEAIRLINRADRLVVSVDVPSGVNADTGQAYDPSITADLTVTMGLPKYGLVLCPGRAQAGTVEVADIGIPASCISEHADTFLLDDDHVRSILPDRPENGHKGTFGTALLVCGSRGYTGAACLAAGAAVRSGCGLVKLAIPKGVADVVETLVTEAVKFPLAQTEAETFSAQALDQLLALLPGVDAAGIGPGIACQPETAALVAGLLPRLAVPFVLDADGINNVAGRLDLLGKLKAPALLTPHPGELSRLVGLPASEIDADRINQARRFAKEHKVLLLLKGAPTVIATPEALVYVNPTGNSGLGSGGTGDVLTGLIAGFIAQGMSVLDAALAGSYLHGRAADLGAEARTEYALAAGDLLDFIPAAFNSLLRPSDS